MIDYKKYAKISIEAKKNSYSPYSNFKVGAVLLSKTGEFFTGTNIENAAYSPGNCAERTAFFKAVSEGFRDFSAIFISGGSDISPEFCFPCGVCRQVIMEFVDYETFEVVVVKSENEFKIYKFSEILPFGFGPNDLKKS